MPHAAQHARPPAFVAPAAAGALAQAWAPPQSPTQSPTQQHSNSADTDLLAGLYAARLQAGPRSQAYYLREFARLDAQGRSLPSWNSAAALCPLLWCSWHGLWRSAALGSAASAAVAAAWALAPPLGLPAAMAYGLGAALVLLVMATAGLAANSFLHRRVRQQALEAVAQSATMAQARQRLAQQAARPWQRALSALALALAPGLALVWGLQAQRLAPAASPVSASPAPQPAALLPQAAASAPSPPAPAPAPAYYLHLGLFADPGLAQQASERLQQAGLAVQQQFLSSNKGERIRLRVGPWPLRELAQRAAPELELLAPGAEGPAMLWVQEPAAQADGPQD